MRGTGPEAQHRDRPREAREEPRVVNRELHHGAGVVELGVFEQWGYLSDCSGFFIGAFCLLQLSFVR